MTHDASNDTLAYAVVGAFYEVYNVLGFGLFEHLHALALERELRSRGHRVAREVDVQVKYKGEPLGMLRLDMLVDERLVVEVQSTPQLHRSATRQVYNYLRATGLPLGLVLHFGPEPYFYNVSGPPLDAGRPAG